MPATMLLRASPRAPASSSQAPNLKPRRAGAPLLSARPTRSAAARGGPVRAEANLFARAVRVFRSYANAIVSAAEDPEKMLDQTVNEMQADLIKMRQASAQVLASQKQVEAKWKAAQGTADEWYKRAELAAGKGDDDLAREALTRRKAYQENADTMKTQLDAQRGAVAQLISNTKVLETKLVEAKSKKDTLKARAKSAATSKQVSEMVQGLNTSNAVTAFERMEEKVLALEGEAEATLALAASDEVENKFKALEGGGGIDAELAALKSGVLGSSRGPPPSLPVGRVPDAIDFELEELRRKAAE